LRLAGQDDDCELCEAEECAADLREKAEMIEALRTQQATQSQVSL